MNSEQCPCGTGRPFDSCCGPFLSGEGKPGTAEQLMRSRYSAYVKKDVGYLVRTTHPKSRTPDLEQSIIDWMAQVSWQRLLVLKTDKATVEFVAEYISKGATRHHRERSAFEHIKGQWFYVGEK